ncbi:bifunctional DNA primase/polymerase [Belnapia moabensis]|uniref:bifunctional DNA primase/polymerase n=1 Tax=Belnapia moabensis TaxID=365533 RepID=UPI00146FDA23
MALLGWRVAPVWPNRAGCFKGYIQAATADLDQIERWQAEYRGCNWSVIPEGSGVWALDVDIPGADHANDGVASLRELCNLHGALPPRPHGRSGGGGHLLVFKGGTGIFSGSSRPAPGLDTLASRSTFTISPSRHRRTGAPYRWVIAPWECPPPPAPEWLVRMLAPPPSPPRSARPIVPTSDKAVRALMRTFEAVGNAPPGNRNNALLRRATLIGGFVAAGAIGRAEAERELVAAGMASGQSRAEAQSTVRSGLRRGEARPLEWGIA